MTGNRSPSERIDELEIHIAHQDHVIEELNKTVASLWDQLDRLSRRLDNLGNRLQSVEERADAPTPVEPPPPHY